MKINTSLCLIATAATWSGVSLAQDTGGGIGLSAAADTDGADASADASADSPDADAAPLEETQEPTAEAQEPGATNTPYMKRYLPQAGDVELGIFGGLMSVSPAHNMKSPSLPHQKYATPGFELGARIGYYPLSWLGVEGEFSMAQAKFAEDLSPVDPALTSNMGDILTYRAHVIGQLPFWSIVPFALVGVGALGATSQPQGHRTQAALHLGVGAKIPFSNTFALRAEFRETFHDRSGDDFGGIAGSEEFLLGAAFKWGRSSTPAAAPAPADQDRDGVPDDQDSCPDVGALTADGCPLDQDGDGVADPDDACPQTAGDLENGCPNLDKDGDGIMLPCDQCPEEVGEAPTGCINRDPDGDGIFGDDDKCPTDPETKNGYEDSDGCPDEVPKEVEKFTGSIDGIWFDIGKSTIKDGSRRALQAAADVLIKYPSVRLEVSGHTSSEGAPEFNQTLSEERAQAVVEWLVNAGVPKANLVSRGAGSDEPVADNKTRIGRTKNRRIEFKILQN